MIAPVNIPLSLMLCLTCYDNIDVSEPEPVDPESGGSTTRPHHHENSVVKCIIRSFIQDSFMLRRSDPGSNRL